MHKLSSLVFCMLSLHLVNGQFSLSGNSDSSSAYPRIKLAGPLGQLIGGQGISLNSGLGQVLSSIISSAANGGSGANSGGPLSQLATAASTNYINAIRSLPPFNQFGGNQQSQQHSHSHSQYNAPSGHQYNAMQNPINFLSPDSNLYGGQGNFENGHFGPNSFQHFPSENFFGGQYGGYNHVPSSNQMGSSALYQGGSYNGQGAGGSGHHNLDK